MTTPRRDIVQYGSGQQCNFFGGASGLVILNGEPVDLNEVFNGKASNAQKPVLGYSIRVRARDTTLLKEHFVALNEKTPLEIKGTNSSRVSLRASGTPEKPSLSMCIVANRNNVTTNVTSRGQCITHFQLEDGQNVNIVGAPVFEAIEVTAPAPAAAIAAVAAPKEQPPAPKKEEEKSPVVVTPKKKEAEEKKRPPPPPTPKKDGPSLKVAKTSGIKHS